MKAKNIDSGVAQALGYMADTFAGMGGGGWDSLFPTLALEVDVSESYSQLCKNAQWWYNNSDHLTRCVVIITATRSPTWRVDV
ncbi:hypothetical protein N7524_001774 [Penicillium chrysogenum]|nr:hypothetical protein N7524_001774 [Penicillium chrysogenum]